MSKWKIVRIKTETLEGLDDLAKAIHKKRGETLDLAIMYFVLHMNVEKAVKNPMFRLKVAQAQLLIEAIKRGELK